MTSFKRLRLWPRLSLYSCRRRMQLLMQMLMSMVRRAMAMVMWIC
jgi:hypothetical protein